MTSSSQLCCSQCQSLEIQRNGHSENGRQAIPSSYQAALSYSDLYKPYETVFDYNLHRCVQKKEGQTNHMERWNNTLRQRVGRYVRKTLSFSKSEEMHHAAVRCFIYDYNASVS